MNLFDLMNQANLIESTFSIYNKKLNLKKILNY
jgi:hypothetical protein